MINDKKEREHYTLKRCCKNCKNLMHESPCWPFFMHWCTEKKKHLGHDLYYDTKCNKFKPIFTPEENKEFYLKIKSIMSGIKK